MAQKGYDIVYRKKGQMWSKATTRYAAKDAAEARKKFNKDHPGCDILEVKQVYG
jgi:hypothetical protein